MSLLWIRANSEGQGTGALAVRDSHVAQTCAVVGDTVGGGGGGAGVLLLRDRGPPSQGQVRGGLAGGSCFFVSRAGGSSRQKEKQKLPPVLVCLDWLQIDVGWRSNNGGWR